MNVMSPTYRSDRGSDERQPAQQAGFDGVLNRLRRNAGLFGIGFSVPVAIAVAVLLFAQPTYTASGSVMVGDQEPSSSSASPAWIQKLGDPADLESQLLILKSNRMLRLVLSRPGVVEAVRRECQLESGPLALPGSANNCEGATYDSPALLRHVERRYGAQAIGRSRVIAISYGSPLPDVAFIMSNALLVAYLEDQRAQNAQSRSLSSAWVLKEGERIEASGADAPTKRFYGDLHKQVSDLETERRVLLNGGRLVSLAEVPRVPYFPKTAPVLAAGLTLGLIVGSLAALFKDMTDHRVRRISDLAAATGLPVVGRVPLAGRRRRRSLQRALNVVDRDAEVSEHLHALYAQFALRDYDKRLRLLVTSSVPSEGKSFTAIALARFVAKAGRRVLIIDCNLRRPSIANALQIDSNIGLANVLRGECAPTDAIQTTSISGLDAMAAGNSNGDPAMLLIDGKPVRKLDEIAGYDLILMDGPACDRFVDGLIFASHADTILWCARWGHTLVADVSSTLDSLGDIRSKVAGLPSR